MKVNGFNGYTATEASIIEMLSDGMPHASVEVHKTCCGPSSPSVVSAHISNIRKKLPAGHVIICELASGRIHYRHARLLASANDGRT